MVHLNLHRVKMNKKSGTSKDLADKLVLGIKRTYQLACGARQAHFKGV